MQQDQLADMLTTLIGMHKNEVYAIQTFSEDKASCARTVGVHFYDPEVAGKLLKFFSQPSSLLDQRCKALLPARSAASNTTRSGHPTVDASYGGTVVTSAVVEGGGFCRAAARNAVRLPSCVLHACMVVEWEDAGMMEVLVEDVK